MDGSALAAFDLALSVMFLAFGLIALFSPEPVRKAFQAGQPFQWARKGYDLPGANLFIRLFGLLFIIGGVIAGVASWLAFLRGG